MGSTAWDGDGLARLAAVIAGHVERGDAEGVAWLVARHGEAHAGATGVLQAGGDAAVGRDSIFRISSLTKPVTAVAALTLVEECRLRLDDPLDRWLPEVAEPRVLADPAGPLDDTVPAERSITLRDLLTFRAGTGWDFTATGPQPVMAAGAEAGLGAGPPAPAGPPEPDEWMRRFGALPLSYQPGERWMYHTSADVLGVLVARVAGRPLGDVLAERIFEPLGMADTGFHVPEGSLDRFGACHMVDPGTGEVAVYDPPDGQWARPPAFPGGGAGLVSTVDDFHAFADMLRGGGTGGGRRILSRPSVELMTTDPLTPAQVATAGPDPEGSLGWGFGLAVRIARRGPQSVGTYGWDGGLCRAGRLAPHAGVGAVGRAHEAALHHVEPATVEQRVEQPGVGAELGAHVVGQLGRRPAPRGVVDPARQPGLDALAGLGRVELVDQVPQAQDAARPEQAGDAVEGDPLPEVGDLVEGVAAVDGVRGRALVLVGQEPGLDDGDVGEGEFVDAGP